VHEELVVRKAGSGLGRYIERLCGYDYRAAGPGVQREPLSTSVVLIIGLGPKLGLCDRRDQGRPTRLLGSFLAGLDDSCAMVAHDGVMQGVQVDLTPLAARMLRRADA
jgi:hypothetical protein